MAIQHIDEENKEQNSQMVFPTSNIKSFDVTCRKCGSKNCTLLIDWAAYGYASWNYVSTDCAKCKTDEVIYDSNP